MYGFPHATRVSKQIVLQNGGCCYGSSLPEKGLLTPHQGGVTPIDTVLLSATGVKAGQDRF